MKHLCTALAMALAAVLNAAVPVRWTASPATPPHAPPPVPHGSTVDFEVTLSGYTDPPVADGADVRLWFQTNNMGDTWFSAPASISSNVITAAFGPEQDTGADRVSLFFGAPSNVFATAILRLTHAPGFTPSDVAPEARSLDFSAVAWTNAPWTTSADVSNLVSRSYVESLGISGGSTDAETVTNVAAAVTSNIVTRSYVESLGISGGGTTAGVTTNDVCNIVTNETVEPWTSWTIRRDGVDVTDRVWQPYYDLYADQYVWYVRGIGGIETPSSDVLSGYDEDADQLTWTTSFTGDNVTTYYTYVATRSRTTYNALGLARLVDLPPLTNGIPESISAAARAGTNYTDAVAASLSADITDLQTESSLIYRLYQGSNVVCEVTNYNSRVNPPMLRLLQLTETNTYITIWTETNGLARIARAATNYTDAAVAAAEAAAAETYAPRGWSATTSGMGAEAPSNTTWISTPTTVFAGGLEYEKRTVAGGQIWILSYHGDTVQVYTNQASNITLMSADGTEAFAVEKTDSYLVGVDADSISVSGNTVTVTVPVVAETHPYVRYTPSLSPVAWEREEDGFTSPISATWSGSSGAWVCTITTTASMGFFAFEFFQEGGVKVSSKGVLEVDAGILCTDGVHKVRPVYNNGSVTWEVFQ